MRSLGAVCFDLDGTLLDTLEEIAVSANTVLAQRGFPVHSVESYRYHVGDGVKRLVERILPEADRAETLIADFTQTLEAEYHRRANQLTRIYPGVSELLDQLMASGIPCAVLSNKPHPLTLDCVRRFFPGIPFAVVIGQRPNRPRKPDPDGALEIAAVLGKSPSEILYVGDTNVDMETAKAAGMVAMGVLWGFREREELLASGADYLVEQPLEIASLLESGIPA